MPVEFPASLPRQIPKRIPRSQNQMKIRCLLPALLLGALSPLLPTPAAHAFVDVSITVAPPVLPVYEQPPCPTEGYLWTPGYWDYADAGYFWVPGVWCAPPRVGFLWTPGYWGYGDGLYVFHRGYWGPTIGFYGGVNYGYGYGGYGYYGGRWDGDRFRYNTAITRVNTTIIHNTYVDKTVIKNYSNGRASFNGPGGVTARPDARQLAAERGPRVAPTSEQLARRQTAAQERRNFTPAPAAKRSADGSHADNRPVQAERRAGGGGNGLSAEEQRVVDRRQQALRPERTPGGVPPRQTAREELPPRQTVRERSPYGDSGRPHGGERPTPADPRATAAGREAKAERQAAKRADRQQDSRKHDKHGDAPGF